MRILARWMENSMLTAFLLGLLPILIAVLIYRLCRSKHPGGGTGSFYFKGKKGDDYDYHWTDAGRRS